MNAVAAALTVYYLTHAQLNRLNEKVTLKEAALCLIMGGCRFICCALQVTDYLKVPA